MFSQSHEDEFLTVFHGNGHAQQTQKRRNCRHVSALYS